MSTGAAAQAAQRVVFGETIVQMANDDDRVLLLDGDLASSTRADIVAQAAPDRFLQMGIAEQNMFGVAAGLAAVGYVPFISTFASFAVCRALDQIRVLIAQPRLPVKIVGSYSGLLTGMTGKTHQVVEDLAVMRSMPGMVVLAPGDDVEAAAALRLALQVDGPVYIRLARDPAPRLFAAGHGLGLPTSVLLREGRDLGIVSTGVHTGRVMEAAGLLMEQGIDASVLHLPTIKPIDERAVIDLAQRTRRMMSSEEHTVHAGLGGAVSEILTSHRPVRLLRHGIADTYGESAPNELLLEKYGLSPKRIAAAAASFVRAAS